MSAPTIDAKALDDLEAMRNALPEGVWSVPDDATDGLDEAAHCCAGSDGSHLVAFSVTTDRALALARFAAALEQSFRPLVALARRGLELASAPPLDMAAILATYDEAHREALPPEDEEGIDHEAVDAAAHAAGLKAVAEEAHARGLFHGLGRIHELRVELAAAKAERDAARAVSAQMGDERDEARAEAAGLERQVRDMHVALDKAGEHVKAHAERADGWWAKADAAVAEKEAALADCDGAIVEHNAMVAVAEGFAGRWKALAKHLRAVARELEGKAARALEHLGDIGNDREGRPVPLVEAALIARGCHDYELARADQLARALTALGLRACDAHAAVYRAMRAGPAEAHAACQDGGYLHEAVHACLPAQALPDGVPALSARLDDEVRRHIDALGERALRAEAEAGRWRACAERVWGKAIASPDEALPVAAGESEPSSYLDLLTHVEQLNDACELAEKQMEALEDAAEFYAEPHRWRPGEDGECPEAIADEGQVARTARATFQRLSYKAPKGGAS